MGLVGIFENKFTDNYIWSDCMYEDEVKEAKYFADDNRATACHISKKSLLYDDMPNYVDMMQSEGDLQDDELYVVMYYWTNNPFCLYSYVDFGITKQEIIENVKAQKYVEGASYYTMGQIFKTTRDYLEGKIE